MRFFSILASFAVLSTVLASPATLKPIERYRGQVVDGSYIVTLRKGVDKKALVKSLGLKLTHDWHRSVNGFAGKFSDETLKALRASDAVDTVAEDGMVYAWASQTDAPWGLARISTKNKLAHSDVTSLNNTYDYSDSAGEGVDVYVIDTGVYVDHSEFEGRARWGKTFGKNADKDGHGHGTHCAGTIAGKKYGVAKAANIIAVKVLSDSGSGTTADVVSGMLYALDSANASGRPSVVSMSLGGSGTRAIDAAGQALTEGGVHLVVAAGNDNRDAKNYSPARVESAITVGAANINDARSSFSNYGSVVDIFAPGEKVISSWIGSTSATNSISGTSMATPHVAGLVAYLISVHGNKSPKEISDLLKSLAATDKLSSIPKGTANALAHNGIHD
ncbi:hypothetical protein HGRIS_011042 [Hohenbuehelia grisea]|uniref:Serine protease n=1 Tax=Hohenbuehelia grisea TaxID=104357 RepID=A0ABR3IYX4_9AGAR